MNNRFITLLEEKGISLSPEQLNQFDTYYRLLIEWNEKINLTAITEQEDVYYKHFYDSLTLAFTYDFSRPLTLCDVGSGAGFPSLPLKICFPEIQVTIVDSLNKRVQFLTTLIEQLGLEHVSVYHDRAETFAKDKAFRESFDVVTARAVAKLPVLSELCLPLVRVGGDFLAMKGASVQAELDSSHHAFQVLGGKLIGVDSLILPGEKSQRHIIRVGKTDPTPKAYPRKPGTPNKRPL